MSRELDRRAGRGQPTTYQVRVAGQLGPRWADWFEGLTITVDGADTLITGPVVDQAALHGLLRRVRDLGLPLVSVIPLIDGRAPDITRGRRDDEPDITQGCRSNATEPDRKDREDR